MTGRYVSRLRRYPALGFLAVAALLASLLPSALRVPLSGPSASAELAPVPGKSDSAQGDLSALGETSTGGLGSGSGLGGLGSTGPGGPSGGGMGEMSPPPPSDGSGRNPAQKRCVGKPPRQTEDPLSPPCVAFFDGDNGGATAKGVTRDEIRLVRTNGCSTNGRIEEVDLNAAEAALYRHFNERYQLYGRRLRIWNVAPPCGNGSDPAYRAGVRWWNEILDPFALIGYGYFAEADEAARLGVWANLEGAAGSVMRSRAPYMRSFFPDLEGIVEHTVEFVCRKAAGRTARYHGEPLEQQKTRKFALTYRRNADPGLVGRDLIVEGIRERCGAEAGRVETAAGDRFPSGSGDWANAWAQDVARWRTAGVTTVIDLDYLSLYAMQVVDAANWYPEWLLVHDSLRNSTTNNLGGRVRPPKQMAHAFGIQFDPLVPERVEQSNPSMAVREQCPDGTCPLPTQYEYYSLLLVFRGIQAAGPKLTAANIDRGLHAIAPQPSPDPFTPAAYFAPGNYSFIKDAAVVRWDPTGTPPGGQPGCWRYVEGGKRYRAEDWKNHPTDDDFDPGPLRPWPCKGES